MTPMARGTVLAVTSAALFGITTPMVRRFGVGVGPFATAALLYSGSALVSLIPSDVAAGPRLGRAQFLRLGLVASLGAALGPAALAFGLQHSGALAGSLLLNLEAFFTVLLARVLYRETLSRRAQLAVVMMLLGGVLLGLRASSGGNTTVLGFLAVVAATLAWAFDNTLTRPLADFDGRRVVFGKSALGVTLSVAFAWLGSESWPGWAATGALLGCGAVGYGLSLRAYLAAQRVLGAARTGSLFALAPFVGAALALGWGERGQLTLVALAAAAFCVAVYWHATEGHGHWHRHEAMEHEHAHRHDDGHHDHVHEPAVLGEHTHSHRHDALEHAHPHGSDLHHRHDHEP
ncbi:MAG: DMT family transporter [Polyangiaceae bacterium]